MSARPLLVLGFEMGDGDTFRRFAADGTMPVVAEFLAGGLRRLASPADRLHIAAWPSLYTGMPPGEHGVYFTFQPRPGVQGWVRFETGLYGVPTLWRRLDGAGVRTLVFDAPYTHPEEGHGGAAVFDWGCWARYLDGVSRPAPLLGRLRRAVGRYPLPWEAHDLGFAPLDVDRVVPALERALAARAQAAAWLLREHAVDFALMVFGETHVAGHYLFGDEDALRRFHAALDDAVGRVLEAAGPAWDVVLVSADGTRPNRAGWHLLPEVLARFGWYASAEHAAGATEDGNTEKPAVAGGGFDPVRRLRDLLPRDLRKSLARRLPRALRDRLARRVDTAAVDWSRTRAYPLPTDLEGLIRLNLRGREPEGTVAPEAARALVEEMRAKLSELVDPGRGRRVVREVLVVDEVFPGRRRDRLPDLVVVWDDAAPVEAVHHPEIGTVCGCSPDPRPGTHAGPGFAATRGGVAAAEGDVLDLAPSVLARFGVAPPAEMRGEVWPEIAAGGDR